MNKIERLLQKYKADRDKLDYLIQTLERDLAEPEESEPRRRGRQRGASVADLAESVLARFPEGLMIPTLILELKKLGYESQADNPANTVNSILHRAEQFARMSDGRWILKKFVAIQPPNPSIPSGTPHPRPITRMPKTGTES
jgi:hypothetical protein